MPISLTGLEERLVVELRTCLQLPLDDIVEVMRRCVNPKLSRSAIHRCLQRHGLGRAQAGQAASRHLRDRHRRLHPYRSQAPARLDGSPTSCSSPSIAPPASSTSRSIARRDAATVAACLERFIAAFPHKVHTILTDNGSEFTDRFGAARWRPQRHATGRHPFDRVCAQHGIQHRLTRPFRPQTNGLVERFNRRLAEAIAARHSVARNEGKNKFLSHAERNAFLNASSPATIKPGSNASTIVLQPSFFSIRRDRTRRRGPTPAASCTRVLAWVPAFAGMTLRSVMPGSPAAPASPPTGDAATPVCV